MAGALRKLMRNFRRSACRRGAGRLVITNPDDRPQRGESVYKNTSALRNAIPACNRCSAPMVDVRHPSRTLFSLSPTRGDDFEIAVRILLKATAWCSNRRRYLMKPPPLPVGMNQTQAAIVSCSGAARLRLFLRNAGSVRGLLLLQLVSNRCWRWFVAVFFAAVADRQRRVVPRACVLRRDFLGADSFLRNGLAAGAIGGERKNWWQKTARISIFYNVHYVFSSPRLKVFFFKQKPFWTRSGIKNVVAKRDTEYRIKNTRIQNTEYRIQIPEYRIQNTEYRIQIQEYRIQKYRYRIRIQNTGIQNTEYRIPEYRIRYRISEYRIQNTEYRPCLRAGSFGRSFIWLLDSDFWILSGIQNTEGLRCRWF